MARACGFAPPRAWVAPGARFVGRRNEMKRALDYFWPMLGMAAVLGSFWLLAR